MTESLLMLATLVYSMDATLTLTGVLRNMYVDDVQTTNEEGALNRSNRYEHDRQLLRVAFESRIRPLDPVTHATGCLMNISNGPIAQ